MIVSNYEDRKNLVKRGLNEIVRSKVSTPVLNYKCPNSQVLEEFDQVGHKPVMSKTTIYLCVTDAYKPWKIKDLTRRFIK